MEVITIDSKAYKEIEAKINLIVDFVSSLDVKLKGQPEEENPDEMWVDGYEVCTFLKISSRTLQRYRSKGILPYYVTDGKVYYKSGEVHEFIRKHL